VKYKFVQVFIYWLSFHPGREEFVGLSIY